jgi:hypothetical protein
MPEESIFSIVILKIAIDAIPHLGIYLYTPFCICITDLENKELGILEPWLSQFLFTKFKQLSSLDLVENGSFERVCQRK